MHELVVEDRIRALRNGGDQAEVSIVAGVEDQAGFGPVKISNPFFHRFAELGIPADQTRSGRTQEVVSATGMALLHHAAKARGTCEAEVVVGAEIDAVAGQGQGPQSVFGLPLLDRSPQVDV